MNSLINPTLNFDTMKSIKYSIYALTFLLVGSCNQEVIDLQDPEPPAPVCTSCPAGATAGTASFAKFVTIGNGFVAGFQAGALYNNGQENSMAKMVATQLKCAGGSATFNQPDINSVNGYNLQSSVPGVIVLGRMVLFDPDGSGPRSASPTPAAFPGSSVTCPASVTTPALPAPYNTADLPTAFTGATKTAMNNYGVPLIYLGQILTPTTGNPGAGAAYNPLWARFAQQPGVKSILDESLAAGGSFYLIWAGLEDALLYAATGADGSYPLTSTANFNTQYNGMITTMLGANPTFKGVVGNIPSVSSFPYFTTVPWNTLKLTAAQVTSLTPLSTGYNGALAQLKAGGIISDAEYTKRLITYKTYVATDPTSATGVLLVDETLTDLSPYFPAELDHMARARQATSKDLIPLAAGAVLGTCYSGQATALFGVSFPVGDKHVLRYEEIVEVETAIGGYNAIIDAAIAGSNNRLALADVKTAYANLLTASVVTKGTVINGVTVASSFAPPAGTFSEDGLHPNNRGNAFTANIFITAINTKFGATVPPVCLNEFGGTGLPVNP
jgi:hypothetical protein